MLKKITAFICSFFVVILACSASFFSFARVPEKSVPFPAPDDFLTPYGSAIVYAYHTPSNSTILWRALYIVSTCDCNYGTAYDFNGSKLTCNFGFAGTIEINAGCFLVYSFAYTSGADTYTTSFKDYFALGRGEEGSVSNTISSNWIFDFVQVYGNCSVSYHSPFSQPVNKFSPTFNGDISYTDISNLFSSVDSDLNTLHSDFNSLIGKVDITNSRLNTLHSDFNTVNSKLTSIDLYCSEILDELRAEDYTEPPQTTENQQMSDYEEAEKVISDDAFNNLDNFEFAAIGDSLDSFGNGFSGALSFLSSNMEFFTGNQDTSYGSTDDDSAIRKISVVILIVLSLGLVSFVLNLVSSKGSD